MLRLIFALFLVATAAAQTSVPRPRVSEYPSASIRETHDVLIDGFSEVWRLQWSAAPRSYCEPNDVSLTCPCTGFAYGEIGDLYVVRLRNGTEIDRLRLTPFFTEQHGAVVQRWPVDYEKDFEASQRDDFSNIVSRRPVVNIMHFADYDHDGRKTEFYLQTESLPCGKSVGIVVGVSKSKPSLHVFTTMSSPDKPLYLQKREWDALRDAASGSVEVEDWVCGDHGAETQIEVVLHWSAKGIDGVRREYTCPSSGETRHLLNEGSLGVDR